MATRPVPKRTMGIRGLLPHTLWPNSCPLVQDRKTPQNFRLSFLSDGQLRYYVARAWCEDRLTIRDARTLSVLWKQLARGVAT